MSDDHKRKIDETVRQTNLYLAQKARERVDALEKAIDRSILDRLDEDEPHPIDGVVFDDHRPTLLQIAKLRDVTIEDVLRLEEDRQKRSSDELRVKIAFWDSCRAQSDTLHVFYVYNTAERKLTVLAKDSACARFFAHRAGHILEEGNGRVMVLKPENEAKLRSDGSALGRALRDGHPGAVEFLGNNVVMKESQRVYTPMTMVPPQ